MNAADAIRGTGRRSTAVLVQTVSVLVAALDAPRTEMAGDGTDSGESDRRGDA